MIDQLSHYELINPIQFILSGKAEFELHNIETNNKYRYKVTKAENKTNLYYVSVHIESEYKYIGTIKTYIENKLSYKHSNKSYIQYYHPAIKGIIYIIEHLSNNKTMSTKMKLYHIGRCGRCGRPLKTKECIIQGFGNECIKYIKGLQ